MFCPLILILLTVIQNNQTVRGFYSSYVKFVLKTQSVSMIHEKFRYKTSGKTRNALAGDLDSA